MRVPRKLLRGTAAVTAGTLPLVLIVTPAAAETKSAQHELDYEFTNDNGDSVVCHILGRSTLTRASGSDPTFDSTSDTLIGIGTSCATSLTITARYTDQDGRARRSSASGLGTLSLQNDDVASGYVATHTITFLDCVNFCTTSFDTRPK
jgi:hypothetical protein